MTEPPSPMVDFIWSTSPTPQGANFDWNYGVPGTEAVSAEGVNSYTSIACHPLSLSDPVFIKNSLSDRSYYENKIKTECMRQIS